MVSDGGKEILVSPRYQKVLEFRIFELGQGSRNQSPEDIYMIYIYGLQFQEQILVESR